MWHLSLLWIRTYYGKRLRTKYITFMFEPFMAVGFDSHDIIQLVCKIPNRMPSRHVRRG